MAICGQNICYRVIVFMILFDLIMQHDYILKTLDFYHLQGSQGGRGVMQAKYLAPCCFNLDSLKFDMQHDHVLKKPNFDLLIPSPGSDGFCGLRAKYLLPCCCNRDLF